MTRTVLSKFRNHVAFGWSVSALKGCQIVAGLEALRIREANSWQAAVGVKQGHRLRVTNILTFCTANQKFLQNSGGDNTDLSNTAGDSMGEHVYSIKLKELIE